MWVADHELDVASDLSAFHRIDDPMTLDADRYFALAYRLPAYSGVIAARVYEETRAADDERGGALVARREPAAVSDDVALAMLADDPLFAPEITREADA